MISYDKFQELFLSLLGEYEINFVNEECYMLTNYGDYITLFHEFRDNEKEQLFKFNNLDEVCIENVKLKDIWSFIYDIIVNGTFSILEELEYIYERYNLPFEIEHSSEICDVCGNNLIAFIDGRTCGLKCLKCNKTKVVTSYYRKWEMDYTKYKIELLPHNDIENTQIKIVARISNCNYIQAKELLTNGGIIIEDVPKNIHRILIDLIFANIKYNITPDYPYK